MSEKKSRKLPIKEFCRSILLRKLIYLQVAFKDLATISRTTFNKTFWVASSKILVVFIT